MTENKQEHIDLSPPFRETEGLAGGILLTGGTGFLGAYIIKALVERGHAVRAIRRSGSTLPFYIPPSIFNKLEWVDGDVLDVSSLADAMQGIKSVVHSAAVVSFSKADRPLMYKVNIEGTANVVNAALEAGVQRLLHVSSVAALGRTAEASVVTEDKKWDEGAANTHYGITKYRAEIEVWRGFAEGLQGAIINPSTILGFGNWHQSSSAIFRNGYKGFPWYTKGVNGFVGVEDVAEAAVRLLLSSINEQRFIINAENKSFQWLLTRIAEGFGKKPPHRYAGPFMSKVAWRLEAAKSLVSGSKPLLTKETAAITHSQTSFSNQKFLAAFPRFEFTPLEEVIEQACGQYKKTIKAGQLSL